MKVEKQDQQDWVQALADQQKRLSTLRVTKVEYQNSINALLELAFMDCGGARHAAQVLLSLYDGDQWRVDLAGVCGGLDSYYFGNVLIALRGRAILMEEPHTLIEGGEAIFKSLANLWTSLRAPLSVASR